MLIESINNNFYNLNVRDATENYPYKTIRAFVQYARSLGYVFSGDSLDDDVIKSSKYFFRKLLDNPYKNPWIDRIDFAFIKNNVPRIIILKFEKETDYYEIYKFDYDLDKNEKYNESTIKVDRDKKLTVLFDEILNSNKTSHKENNYSFLFKRLNILLKKSFIEFADKEFKQELRYKFGSENDKNRKLIVFNFILTDMNYIDYDIRRELFKRDFSKKLSNIISTIEKHSTFKLYDFHFNDRNVNVALKFVQAESNEKMVTMFSHKTIEVLRQETILKLKSDLQTEFNFSTVRCNIFDKIFKE